MAEQETPSTGGEIIAAPAREYRLKRLALVAIIFIYGGMSVKDGFFKYPRENADFIAAHPDAIHIPHPGLDIPLNRAFGVLLPPLSLLFLVWTFYVSRGTYRFDGNYFFVPGHPPIPLHSVRSLNRAKWDRKGIAYVDYQLDDGSVTRTFKLDDFIYQRQPTDQIFSAIEAALGSGEEAPVTDPQPAPVE